MDRYFSELLPAAWASRSRTSWPWAGRTPTTRTSRSAWPSWPCTWPAARNGVSKLHGEVSRQMWQECLARRARGRDPHQVHHQRHPQPTWTAPRPGRALRPLPGPASGTTTVAAQRLGAMPTDIPDESCGSATSERRERLVVFARQRMQEQLAAKRRHGARDRGRRRGPEPRRPHHRLRRGASPPTSAPRCSSATPSGWPGSSATRDAPRADHLSPARPTPRTRPARS